MVREIRWSLRADREREEIETYWINRNKSNIYSLRLDRLLRQNVYLLAEIPELGKPTKLPDIRFIIVLDYLVNYRITPTIIEIITIWDSRRNPKKLKL